MKQALQIGLYILSIFFAYMIYKSITGPIEFKKIKQERYAQVISNLKDIRDAQEAHRTVKGVYAADFNSLVNFIETAKYTITTQRDTSWMEYDPNYRIDVMKEGSVIDTLGFVAVKDSLFKNSDRYKKMMYVPFAKDEKTTFEMKADILDKNGYKAPVFEAKTTKSIILWDQPEDYLAKENTVVNVEDIDGPEIRVGPLSDISTAGNWPTIYDAKKNK